MTVRREIPAPAFFVKRPSTGSGCPESVEGRIACLQGKFNAQFQVEGQSKFSYAIACKFRNCFLAYGFNWELFTIDQSLCVENAIVLCQIDPLLGDERA